MTRYLDTATFRDLTVLPAPDVDQIGALEGEWIQRQIDRVGAMLDARLAKRYAVPFGSAGVGDLRADVPQIIQDWITAIVTVRCYAKRGINPSSAELWYVETVLEPSKRAIEEIKEAASSNEGLFDLPLKESQLPAGGASRSGP